MQRVRAQELADRLTTRAGQLAGVEKLMAISPEEKKDLAEEVRRLRASAKLLRSIPLMEQKIKGLEEEVERLMELYRELDGCTWRREDGGENRLAVAMANVRAALVQAAPAGGEGESGDG